jgi:hypothetical protein
MREAAARPGRPGPHADATSSGGAGSTGPVALRGEARDVALAEAQAVLAMVRDPARRERLAGLVAAADEGSVEGEDAEALEELLELGLQSGRIRALYGPGGEQAALQTYRKLPAGADAARSAREVSAALRALAGRELEGVTLQAVGPGAFSLSLSAGGLELGVRLDRSGARVSTVGA